MTDKEMLELAAKAAGILIEWGGKFTVGTDVVDCTDLPYSKSNQVDVADAYWNPLDDDGDALRLAVKLEINVLPSMEQASARNPSYTGWVNEDASKDPYAATRRAITRAAAEIGKGMK